VQVSKVGTATSYLLPPALAAAAVGSSMQQPAGGWPAACGARSCEPAWGIRRRLALGAVFCFIGILVSKEFTNTYNSSTVLAPQAQARSTARHRHYRPCYRHGSFRIVQNTVAATAAVAPRRRGTWHPNPVAGCTSGGYGSIPLSIP
jgi:hypothetical protein